MERQFKSFRLQIFVAYTWRTLRISYVKLLCTTIKNTTRLKDEELW